MTKVRRLKATLIWVLGAAAAVILIIFVLVVGPWLLTRPAPGLTTEQLKARNDARTTLVQAVGGLVLAGGLIATYRTYRLNKSQQVTDTYTKAVEQLGHNQAPVRLGALYSLAQLGQDNLQRRQMVVDVLCAYLRMPSPPLVSAANITPYGGRNMQATDPDDTAESDATPSRDLAQEWQVRRTAQRLLAAHLRSPTSWKNAQTRHASRGDNFWPGISLDLTGTTLVDFDFHFASLVDANFSNATFDGTAEFRLAEFKNSAWFDGATFRGDASFSGTRFDEGGSFVAATFNGSASFHGATFSGILGFGRATFAAGARFQDLTNTKPGDWEGFGISFDGAQVLHFDDNELNQPVGNLSRVWPKGFAIHPYPDDPTRGRLVPTWISLDRWDAMQH